MAGLNTTSSNMSLRENTLGRIVRTDILVGPRPAGPSNPSPPPLDCVFYAADEGGLLDRRADRPGNPFVNRPRQHAFLPPIFIPNSPLNVPLAISPGKNHSTTGRANPGGSPLPPPTALLRCLPDFAHCFSHLCDHPSRSDHHLRGADEYLDVGPGGEDERGPFCHRCNSEDEPGLLRRTMHELPCGHMLCPSHLTQAATHAVSTANSRVPGVRQALREASGELARLRRDLVPRETAPRMRASQERRIVFYEGQLLSMLGLACCCCGEDMRLLDDDDGWVLCLDEWLARQLWAACWRLFRGGWMMDGTAASCGWPDCRAVIPVWCRYVDSLGKRVFFCAACEGNSVEHRGGLWPTR